MLLETGEDISVKVLSPISNSKLNALIPRAFVSIFPAFCRAFLRSPEVATRREY